MDDDVYQLSPYKATSIQGANPQARRNSQVPPTTGNSLTGAKIASLDSMGSVLPLYFPSVNTRLVVNSKAVSAESQDANTYKPWARPTSFDVNFGPFVSGVVHHKNMSKVVVEPWQIQWPLHNPDSSGFNLLT